MENSQSPESASRVKPESHRNPQFTTKRDSKPDGLRDKAMKLVAYFGGECLSGKKLSIVKGLEAFKFKCINGHVFYKFVTEIAKLPPLSNRKLSKTTAASSSSSQFSDEDMLGDSWQGKSLDGIWCPKCQAFFKGAEVLAKNCGFKLYGEMFSSKLVLKCLKAKHVTPLSYNRRMQGNLKCSGCRKDEREAVKQRLREEERQKEAYYAEM